MLNKDTTNSNVYNSCHKLIGVLDDLIKQYRLLLDLVRKEKEILIAADIEALSEINQSKDNYVITIRSLDAQRIKYVESIGYDLNIATEQLRLLEIAKLVPDEIANRFRSQHATLDLIIRRLSEINKENSVYAESALRNVNGAMENLKDTITGKTTYQHQGKYQRSPESAGHLVRKEA